MGIQTLVKDVGGTIETYFEDARPSSVTVTVYTGEGAKKIDGEAATVDSVSTTVSSAVTKCTTTVALTSAASVVSGRRYILGVDESTAPKEIVTVKSVDSSTATLFAPTLYAHNSGDAFRGGRVSYSFPAASADVTWFDGYADWTPASGDPITETVDCALRKIPDDLIDWSYCLRWFPKGGKTVDAELDMRAALRDARDRFLRRLGGRVRTHKMLGSADFKLGAALEFWAQRMVSWGEEWAEDRAEMEKRIQDEVDKLRSTVPVDIDDDNSTQGTFDVNRTTGFIGRS